MADGDGRTKWSDERLDDILLALRSLPAETARVAVKVETNQTTIKDIQRLIEKLDDKHDADMTALRAELASQAKDYRRNIIAAIIPIILAAVGIFAKVVLGLDIPGTQ